MQLRPKHLPSAATYNSPWPYLPLDFSYEFLSWQQREQAGILYQPCLTTVLCHVVLLLLSDLFLNRQVSPSLFSEKIGMTLEPAAQSAGSRAAAGHGDGSVN